MEPLLFFRSNFLRMIFSLVAILFLLIFSQKLFAQDIYAPGALSGGTSVPNVYNGDWNESLVNPKYNGLPYGGLSFPNDLSIWPGTDLGVDIAPSSSNHDQFNWLLGERQLGPVRSGDSVEELLRRYGVGDPTAKIILERFNRTGQITAEDILGSYPGRYLDPSPFPIDAGAKGRCCPTCICGGEPTGPICIPPSCINSPVVLRLNGDQIRDHKFQGFDIDAASDDEDDEVNFQTIVTAINVEAPISKMNRLAPMSYFTTVGLQSSDSQVFCSGALIDEDSVLTAAHCLCDHAPSYVFVGNSVFADNQAPAADVVAVSMPVQAGADFFNGGFCEAFEAWRSEGRTGQYPSGDLAILHLEERLPPLLSEFGLPTEPIADQGPAPFIYGVGFGRADGIDTAGEKHRARFRFLSRLCTEDDASEHGCHVGEENVISSFEESAGQDSCFGDSGGPIFIRGSADSPVPDGGFDTPPRLVAITSRGLATNAKGFCGRGAINVSLEREEVRNWITEQK
ncbi:trypsin-like serine protease [Roseobacter litoralis]|uniref:trypsin-like serine protease n=1 Tax=Roseobacter litoralis TaxID=42443 RepID=UPI00249596C0|nr:trypsin-like serine protease [Roseobacter litoralis]